MSHGQLVATVIGAGAGLVAAGHLARLTVSVPDREAAAWWWGAAAGSRGRLATATLAVVFGALAGRAAGLTALLPAFVLLALFCAPLAVIDFEHHRLPNRLVFPAAIAVAGLLAGAAAVRTEWSSALRGAEAAAAVFAIFYLLALVAPFGYGDVKLGAVLAGALGYLGWAYVLYGIVAGFVIASLASLPLMALRRATLKTAIPLGPALIFGALLVSAFRLVPTALA